VALCVAVPAAPAHADGVLPSGYQVVAQAPVLQWTYDFPTANFHPQADSELTYAEVDGDPSRAHALSSVVWPGAAGGNFGSLVGVLAPPGVPPPPNSILDALNDPVRAEAATGGTTQQVTAAPTGTAMKASVVPEQSAITQEASSVTTSAGISLGPSGSLGASSATAKHTLDQNGSLVATAESFVSNVDLGTTFHADSITASATEQSVAGATPTGSSTITVQNLVIGGQKAYVDGGGVHMGEPGKPAGSAAVDGVNKALAGAGMQIYFTVPGKVTIGGVAYDYSASILVYWAPPGDSHDDVFTFSFGGAAIGIVASPGLAASAGAGDQGVGGGGGGALLVGNHARGRSHQPVDTCPAAADTGRRRHPDTGGRGPTRLAAAGHRPAGLGQGPGRYRGLVVRATGDRRFGWYRRPLPAASAAEQRRRAGVRP
jgi:hypothetical protein